MAWNPKSLSVHQARWLAADAVSVDELPYRNDEKDHLRLKAIAEELKYRKTAGSNYLSMAYTIGNHRANNRAAENGWKKLRKEVPKGPVTLNQALLGDPLPGRSCLDKKTR